MRIAATLFSLYINQLNFAEYSDVLNSFTKIRLIRNGLLLRSKWPLGHSGVGSFLIHSISACRAPTFFFVSFENKGEGEIREGG